MGRHLTQDQQHDNNPSVEGNSFQPPASPMRFSATEMPVPGAPVPVEIPRQTRPDIEGLLRSLIAESTDEVRRRHDASRMPTDDLAEVQESLDALELRYRSVEQALAGVESRLGALDTPAPCGCSPELLATLVNRIEDLESRLTRFERTLIGRRGLAAPKALLDALVAECVVRLNPDNAAGSANASNRHLHPSSPTPGMSPSA